MLHHSARILGSCVLLLAGLILQSVDLALNRPRDVSFSHLKNKNYSIGMYPYSPVTDYCFS